jgi:hypothetical protein
MFTIKFDSPFTPQEKSQIQTAAEKTAAMSALAVTGVSAALRIDKEGDRIIEWFGSSIPLKVAEGVRKMDAFLQDGGRTVTFVDRRHKSEKEIIYRGPGVQAQYGRTIPMTECDYAYVKNLPDYQTTGEAHVGSGMRLYLGERFFNPTKTTVDRAATIYHEIAHKILAIPDIVYKAGPCRNLARTRPQDALRNADSWCLYASSFIFTWP